MNRRSGSARPTRNQAECLIGELSSHPNVWTQLQRVWIVDLAGGAHMCEMNEVWQPEPLIAVYMMSGT